MRRLLPWALAALFGSMLCVQIVRTRNTEILRLDHKLLDLAITSGEDQIIVYRTRLRIGASVERATKDLLVDLEGYTYAMSFTQKIGGHDVEFAVYRRMLRGER